MALVACVPGSTEKMKALNSWGANTTYMDVTAENFILAMTFDPIIVQVHRGAHAEELPEPMELYRSRLDFLDSNARDEERQIVTQRKMQAKIELLQRQLQADPAKAEEYKLLQRKLRLDQALEFCQQHRTFCTLQLEEATTI